MRRIRHQSSAQFFPDATALAQQGLLQHRLCQIETDHIGTRKTRAQQAGTETRATAGIEYALRFDFDAIQMII